MVASALKSKARLKENSSSFTQSGLPLITSLNLPSVVTWLSLLLNSSFTRNRLPSRTKATMLPSGLHRGTSCGPPVESTARLRDFTS